MGFQNLNTAAADEGSKMLVPTFLDVSGSTNGYILADLSVTGYTPPKPGVIPGTFTGGCKGGDFIVRQLTKGGKYEEDQYYWIDNGKLKGWFASASGTAIEGGAASVKFSANKGLWIFGSGYQLVGSGSVNFEEVHFATIAEGNIAVGNGNPVELKLSDLTVADYPPPKPGVIPGTFTGGCKGGDFIVRQLTPGGKYEEDQYYWIDNGKLKGWFASASGTAIDGGAESVSLPAGTGLWVFGSGYTLIIPGTNVETK